MSYAGRWWHMLDDGRMQCDLCPRDCRLHEGQRGACFVRQREGDAVVLTTYGTLRRDVEHLRTMEFEYVILDESQAIKNASTVAAKAVRLLRSRHQGFVPGLRPRRLT